METAKKNRTAPHGLVRYAGGQELEVRVEQAYGLRACLEILEQDGRVLDALAREAGLPESSYSQAAAERVVPSVTRTEVEIPMAGSVAWEKRYEAASPDLADDPPLPTLPQRAFRKLRRILGRARPAETSAAAPESPLEKYACLFLANDAPWPRGLRADFAGGPPVHALTIGEPPPGLRVPMFSGYASPAEEHPSAVILRGSADQPEVRDALFKIGVDDVALVDAHGAVTAIQPKDTKTEPRAPEVSVSEWPRISVITVSYNQAKYLPECLASVLGQGYPHLDFVVIDGGSTDGSREILERHREKLSALVIEPDRGQSHALNKGFALAKGEMLTWLCSDDRLEPGALGAVAESHRRTSCDLVVGGCRVIDGEGRTKTVHHSAFVTETVSPLSFGDLASFTATWQRALYFYQPEVFFTHDLWQRSGAHVKEHLHYAMDYDLFLRFALAGADVFATRQILGCSRQHSEQKTRHETPLYLPTVSRILRDFHHDLAALQPDDAA